MYIYTCKHISEVGGRERPATPTGKSFRLVRACVRACVRRRARRSMRRGGEIAGVKLSGVGGPARTRSGRSLEHH